LGLDNHSISITTALAGFSKKWAKEKTFPQLGGGPQTSPPGAWEYAQRAQRGKKPFPPFREKDMRGLFPKKKIVTPLGQGPLEGQKVCAKSKGWGPSLWERENKAISPCPNRGGVLTQGGHLYPPRGCLPQTLTPTGGGVYIGGPLRG